MNPDLVTTISTYIWALDYGSVLVFALTGALVASRQQLDIIGFIFMASLTAVGGGTLRDLVLGRAPVFWVAQPELIVIAAAAAFLVFWTAHLLESRYRWLLWLDAIALGVAVPAGVGVAMAGGFGPVIIVIAGVITGTMGGLMRDVVGNEVPLILKGRELYLTCAFGGAVIALLLAWLGLPRALALTGGGLATFLLRAGTLIWGWSLPVYKPRPPRTRG
ncbi:MAG TPA: trimeric intracellular cation channel family protein [Paracoccus sp. (in: a-proteobacteria)]|uniref:trimeric intracellular cation channel family protein n=1 Tax=uncultured Paracoccus sp. TaxID=189685 RepID=UPI00262A4DEE|nr:trimeric intracellular cation channel family protein [uncultured Paracoccus sp.]HMQ40286.1 trimeric intracellular cation channel family protein [Paracoccus sp. (in: a-proteobacteria)]HMR35256.1 trimeric intracellular cation channel family protein [Paracoccus sp. (in: a-proteobacteria)]